MVKKVYKHVLIQHLAVDSLHRRTEHRIPEQLHRHQFVKRFVSIPVWKLQEQTWCGKICLEIQ